MLQPMQQSSPTQPSPSLSDFAGLLATLASPPPEAAEDAPLWNTSDLGEDVATLSYENALSAHARYRPLDRGVDNGANDQVEWPLPLRNARAASGIEAAIKGAEADAAPLASREIVPDRDLRSASVTIRLSKAECAQLRQRAAEAGMTVSAYLRSCALEAEVLRAQVKQALAELKAGSKTAEEPGSRGAREPKNAGWRQLFGWIQRLLKRRQ